ncbi:hypothetical protein N7463_002376 [Penicillium fimorum]|uniref:NADP-dependent oxidoreductase domain-containing protein n=1 Tax=Penicillium fimorum TaxID=1882269 RepID=A0A9X0C8X8_9EURO|nr:hypothetical protein N7463_002376 [Penicillium fimorum]
MSPKVPIKVILGTHTVGDGTKGKLVSFDKPDDVKTLLTTFNRRGYNEIDTAANYCIDAPGTSEDRLGKADAASKFVIHTKVLDGPPGSHEAAKITASINKSLASLKTPAVQTIFLHVPDRQTPFEDTIRAIDDAVQQGKAKNFGLSNYTASEVQQIIDICEKNGYTKPSVYEGHYNPIVRGGEKELFPLLRKHNMSFLAYSPAAGGLFSGNTKTSSRWAGDNQIAKLYSTLYGKESVQASVNLVIDSSAKHGISGHAAAVRWTAFHSILNGQFGDGVIFGVSKLEQVDRTLDALEAGPLPEEVADAITAVYETVEGSEPAYHL